MAFRARKVFETFEKQATEYFLYFIDHLADFAILVNIKALSNIIVAKVPKSLIFGL